ncbi:MAG TPA: hypothetical protein VF318_05860, partial [Dehalococcoidales bacterium]
WRGKHKISWLLLALGTMTKFYPIVIAPVYVFYYLRNRQYRNLWSGVLIFAFTCLIVLAPFFILSPDALRNLISYHSQRGLQLESTYSSFLLIADKLGLTSVGMTFSYGSWNLTGHLADVTAKASTYVLGLLLLVAYWFIYGQIRPGKSQFTRIGTYSLLLVTITLIASKVFSPQYLIWLIPLVPLVFNRFRYLVWIVFVAIGAATFYIFPSNYLTLLNLDTRMVAMLFLRDIFLILLAVVAFVSLTRMKSSE